MIPLGIISQKTKAYKNVALDTNGASITLIAGDVMYGSVNHVINGTRGFANSQQANQSVLLDTSINNPVIEVDFGGLKSIKDVYLIANYGSDDASTLTPTTSDVAYSLYIIDYTVEYWNGVSWSTLFSDNSNNKIMIASSPLSITTNKIRLTVTASDNNQLCLIGIEAWGDN